jgi:hypothetical protein
MKRLWWWLILAIAVLTIIPFSFLKLRAWTADRSLQEQMRLALKEGIPTSGREYAAFVPTSRPEENAAAFYRKLGRFSLTANEGIMVAAPTFSGDLTAQKQILAKYADKLGLVDKATALPHCWFDRDWSSGAAVLFPEFAPMKQTAKLLGLRGSVAAARGDSKRALADIDRMFKIADHVTEEGTGIANLVGIAIDHLAQTQLAYWASAYPDKPEYRKALVSDLRRWKLPNVKQMHREDLFMLIDCLDLSTTKEGRADLGLRPGDEAPFETVASVMFNRTNAKSNIIRNYRRIWAQLGKTKPDEQELKDAEFEMLKSMAAFPTGSDIYIKLSSGDGSLEFLHDDQSENLKFGQLKYIAVARAMASGRPAKTIETSDLICADGKPIGYKFDGHTMTITSSRDGDRPQVFTIPPKLKPLP